jgi:hypothetical protein
MDLAQISNLAQMEDLAQIRIENKKRSPGGQPGNTNSIRQPWTSFMRRRALKDADAHFISIQKSYIDELRADKPDMTTAELRVCELAATARVCWSMALQSLNDEDSKVDPKASLEALRAFMGIELQSLSKLGLARRARRIDPAAVLKEIDGMRARWVGPWEATHVDDRLATQSPPSCEGRELLSAPDSARGTAGLNAALLDRLVLCARGRDFLDRGRVLRDQRNRRPAWG